MELLYSEHCDIADLFDDWRSIFEGDNTPISKVWLADTTCY